MRPVAALLLCLTLAAVLLTTVTAPRAIWAPQLVDHPGFSPVDPVVVQEVWPAAGLAFGPGSWVMQTGRALFGDAGSAGAIAIAAVLTVLMAWLILYRLTGSTLVASASALGLACGGVFWSRVAGSHPAIFNTLLATIALGGLVLWIEAGRLVHAIAAVVAFSLLVAAEPSSVLAVLVIAPGIGTRWQTPVRTRLALAVAAVCAAAVGAWLGWRGLGGGAPGDWLLPVGGAAVAARLASVGDLAVSDFGILGLGLLAAGLWTLAVERRVLFGVLAGWVLVVGAGSLLWAVPDWRSSSLPAIAPAWVIVGAGMQWVLQASGQGRRVATALVVLLPAMSLAGHAWMGARAHAVGGFVARTLDGLASTLPPTPAALLAEGGMLDRAIVGRTIDSAEVRWSRVAQDPDRIDAARAAGRSVVAFAGARANLNELGYRFVPVADTGVQLSVAELIETVPDGWIVAAAVGPRFAAALASENQQPFMRLGGRLSPSGSAGRSYAIAGVKGTRAPVPEAHAEQAIAEVRAGDPHDQSRRWPASVRAVGERGDSHVEYAGRIVARTETGIALAVVTSTGDLAGAFEAEYAPDVRLRLTPASFRPALVTGREPCVSVPAGRWTDVSSVSRLTALGSILQAGEHVVIYAGGPRALVPRLKALGHARAPSLRVTEFAAADRQSLVEALSGDRLDRTAPFETATHVYRIQADSPGGSSQLALRLGGGAETAVARLSSADPDRVLAVCGAMRGGPGLFAEGFDPGGEEVDLANDELFPYGWGRLEGGPASQIRWTGVYEAQMLVPLARTGRFTLLIDALPVGDVPTTMEVRVNDVGLEPVTLGLGDPLYRWELPAGVLGAGMNRLEIVSSALTRPSDISASLDDRQLAIAVRAVRFVLQSGSGGAGLLLTSDLSAWF